MWWGFSSSLTSSLLSLPDRRPTPNHFSSIFATRPRLYCSTSMTSPSLGAPRPSRGRRRRAAQFFLAEPDAEPDPTLSTASSPLDAPPALGSGLAPGSYSHLDGLRTSTLDLPTRHDSRFSVSTSTLGRRHSSFLQLYGRGRAHAPALGLASPITGLSLAGSAAAGVHEMEMELDVRHVEMLRLLMEIHRVLYRGEVGMEMQEGGEADTLERGADIRVLAERFFEGDCIYDHPLVQISGRTHMVAHFIVLNLVACAQIRVPAFCPASVARRVGELAAFARQSMVRAEMMDEEKGYEGKSGEKGFTESGGGGGSGARQRRRWWKLWDVSSEVRDLGAMETFDGHHSGKIDHVVTLSILPALLSPCPPPRGRRHTRRGSRRRSDSASSAGSLESGARSYAQKLAAALADEFEPFLRWRLPMSTLVEFNEVGRAVRVRDQVDVRDLIEAVVPFAKTLNGLSRRVAGFVCGALGAYAIRCLPGERGPREPEGEATIKPSPLQLQLQMREKLPLRRDSTSPIRSPADIPLSHSAPAFSSGLPSPPDAAAGTDPRFGSPDALDSPSHNSLGLVTSAPDCHP